MSSWDYTPKPTDDAAARQERENVVGQWARAKEAAAVAVEAERALREKAFSLCFPTADRGTSYAEMPNNHRLKCVISETFEFKKGITQEEIEKLFTVFNRSGEIGEMLIGELTKETVELSSSRYRRFRDEDTFTGKQLLLETLQPLVVMKRGLPQMELISPDKKK